MEISRNMQIVAGAIIVVLVLGLTYNYAILQPAKRREQQEEEESLREAAERARIKEWEETLIIGDVIETKHPHPYIGYGDPDLFLTLGRLIESDINVPALWHNRIAESYTLEHKADGTPYTKMKIKKGLKFQDGTDINATAIKWSIEKAEEMEPGLSWTRGSLSCVAIEAPDTYTLHFIHETDFGHLGTLGFLGCPYYYGFASPTAVQKYDPDTEPLKVVGAGPYSVVEWIHMERVVLERWDDYPWEAMGRSGPFRFKRIVIRLYPDASTLRAALETSEVDIAIRGITKFDLIDLDEDPDINVGLYESQVRLLLMDQHYDYFKNEKVRQAIAYIVDQEELVTSTVPMCTVTYSFPTHLYSYYFNDEAWTSRYKPGNIEKAKELMVEAGYPDGFKTDLCYLI